MPLARLIRICRLRLRSLVAADALDEEIAGELAFHYEQLVEEGLADGCAPAEARRRAHRLLGSAPLVKDQCRDKRRTGWIIDGWRDLRHGVRMLRMRPGSAIIMTSALALGLGMNGALLGALHRLLVDPLPFRDASRLVVIRAVLPEGPQQNDGVPLPTYLAWRSRVPTLADIGVSLADSQFLAADTDGAAERLTGQRFTPTMFDLLGVRPLVGRVFTTSEANFEHPEPVIVISHGLWLRRYGGDPAIAGRGVVMNGVQTTILGVMPPEFAFINRQAAYWAPLGADSGHIQGPGRYHILLARLRTEATLEDTRATLESAVSSLGREGVGEPREWRLSVVALRSAHFGWATEPLVTLEVAVLLMLLVSTANISILLLARSRARSSEMAMRLALGATRVRLARQLLAENLALSMTAAVLATAIAALGLYALNRMPPPPAGLAIPPITLDGRLLGLIALSSIAAALACSVAPALIVTRRVSEATSSSSWTMVGAQAALALVLLAGAGLLFNSLLRVSGRELNVDPSNLLTFQFRPPPGDESRRPTAFEEILHRLHALPEIESAATISALPVNSFVVRTLRVAAEPTPAARAPNGRAPTVRAAHFLTSPGLFATLGAPLTSGREFDAGARADTTGVVLVNESLVRSLWPRENPIGRRLTLATAERETSHVVVGVVGDIPLRRTDAAMPIVYSPYQQADQLGIARGAGTTFIVRYRGESAAALGAVQQALAEVAPDAPMVGVSTMAQYLYGGGRMREQPFYVGALGFFAAVATALTALGVFGVTTYDVAKRTREVGIRVTLGARPLTVLMVVGGGAIRALAAGLAAGLVAALVAGQLLASQLWGVPSADPATIAAATLLLLAVGVLACAAPLRRALAICPADALRSP